MASGIPIWFDTIFGTSPSLRTTSGLTSGQVATAAGYQVVGDGGGGDFVWDSSSNAGDDGGTIIVPAGATGRWLRMISGPCDPRWFGALLGVGKSSTDRRSNKAALYNAVNAAILRGIPLLIPGILECEVQLSDVRSVEPTGTTVHAGVVINGGLVIQGLGVDVSSLGWFNDATPGAVFDYYAMYIDAYKTKANVEFRELTILGPPHPSPLAEPNTISLIRHKGDTRGATITNATNANPIQITTSTAHGWSNGDIVLLRNIRGANTGANGRFKITGATTNGFSLQDPLSDANVTGSGAYWSVGITAATKEKPIKITTAAAHGRVTNDMVSIVNVGGNTAANGLRRVTVVNTTQFSLQDPVTGDPIQGNDMYTGGGTACDGGTAEPDRDYVSFVSVRLDGKCNNGFLSNDGNTWTTFDRVRGRSYRGFGGYFTTTGAAGHTDKRLTLLNSEFYGAGYSTVPINGVTAYPWYIHPSVSLLVDGCRFRDSNRYGIHIYGSPKQRPQYCIIQNSLFDSDCVYGILTNPITVTKILGCTFLYGGIQYQNEILVEDCDLRATIYPIVGVSGRNFKVANSLLRPGEADYGGGSAGTAITTAVAGSRWIVDACDIRAGIGVTTSVANTLLVSNCVASLLSATGAPLFVWANANPSIVYIHDNVVTSGYLAYIGKGPTTVELWQNRCLDSNYGRLYLVLDNVDNGNPIDNGVIKGWENYFANGSMFLYDTTSWQRVGFRRAQAASSIASAATLTLPDVNSDTYRITGTATITNIYVNSLDVTRKCSGRICLMADGAFTWDPGAISSRQVALGP